MSECAGTTRQEGRDWAWSDSCLRDYHRQMSKVGRGGFPGPCNGGKKKKRESVINIKTSTPQARRPASPGALGRVMVPSVRVAVTTPFVSTRLLRLEKWSIMVSYRKVVGSIMSFCRIVRLCRRVRVASRRHLVLVPSYPMASSHYLYSFPLIITASWMPPFHPHLTIQNMAKNGVVMTASTPPRTSLKISGAHREA